MFIIFVILFVLDSYFYILVRVIPSRMIAFVRYTIRTAAEFAKEAMADQSISKGEILNIRWSHEDPNPTAQRYEEHELTRRAAEGIKEKSKQIGVPDYMIDSHQPIEEKEHPYAKILRESRQKKNKTKEIEQPPEQDLSTQQQYFLQWAQFFAQQGIDPSQLDEATLQYYQQYYSAYYYSQAYAPVGVAPMVAQPGGPALPPALVEATKEQTNEEGN